MMQAQLQLRVTITYHSKFNYLIFCNKQFFQIVSRETFTLLSNSTKYLNASRAMFSSMCKLILKANFFISNKCKSYELWNCSSEKSYMLLYLSQFSCIYVLNLVSLLYFSKLIPKVFLFKVITLNVTVLIYISSRNAVFDQTILYSSCLFRPASYEDFTNLHLYTQLQNAKRADQYASKKQYDRSLKVQQKKRIIKKHLYILLTTVQPRYTCFSKYLLRRSGNSQFSELP